MIACVMVFSHEQTEYTFKVFSGFQSQVVKILFVDDFTRRFADLYKKSKEGKSMLSILFHTFDLNGPAGVFLGYSLIILFS